MTNRLRDVRESIGMPVSELAKRAGTSRQTITNIELHGQEPGISLALSISKALKVDPREIFFENIVIQGLQKNEEVI